MRGGAVFDRSEVADGPNDGKEDHAAAQDVDQVQHVTPGVPTPVSQGGWAISPVLDPFGLGNE